MKIRNTILAMTFTLLLSSCVVKSLNPFYTKDTISFDEKFIGEWKDSKKGTWKIITFKEEFEKDLGNGKMSKDDVLLYEEYKNSYYIQREYKGQESLFLATPFIINNQTFLDFYPLIYQEGIDNLLESHAVYTHSLVKYDITKKGEILVKWLDEDKIEALFKQKKIKIKHEKIGVVDERYLLTASSEELQKFIKKYMASNDSEKWETSTKFTLTKANGTK